MNESTQLVSGDFLRVLLALKENIMRDLNVAEICRVQSITQGNYFCESLADSTVINAMSLANVNASVGDIVLVVFCNRDFRANLKMINYRTDFVETENNQRHSNAFGVIVGKVISEGD